MRAPSGDHPLLEEFRNSGHSGLILLSSGSTGQIKASLHSFPRLLANYQRRRTSPYRTLAFLMLDHIGGINTLFHILCSGGTVVTPAGRTPEAICEAIQRHRVQLLPTTPTFLRMLLISEAYKKYDLGSLELITYGTEPMPPATLESLHAALPGVRLKQTYGLTEVGILPTKSESNDSLWLAVGGEGYETKIVDGVLWIRTQTAMIGYLNAPSPFDADGWFNTGDMVEQRGELHPLPRPQVGNHQRRRREGLSRRSRERHPADGEHQGGDGPRPCPTRSPATSWWPRSSCRSRRTRTRWRGGFARPAAARLAPFKIPAMIEVASDRLCGERFKKIRKTRSAACGREVESGCFPRERVRAERGQPSALPKRPDSNSSPVEGGS